MSIGYTCTGFDLAGKWIGKKPSVAVTNRGTKRKVGEAEAVESRPSLILCQVVKAANVKEVFKAGPGAERCWAIVVPDVDQILPRFVLHLKTKK